MELKIPYPPKDVFEHDMAPTDQITQETQYVNVIEKIEYPESGGIFVYLRDTLFPTKGFPTPEALLAMNLAKRLLISQFVVAVNTPLRYFLALAMFLPWKQKINVVNTFLNNYNQVSDRVLGPYYLKINRMTSLGQEMYAILMRFLTELGVGSGKIELTARIFSSLIDCDTAYRYRIEDLMSETSKEQMLKRPIREIRRLLKILQERDARVELNSKFRAIGLAIAAMLLIPRIRKSFKNALKDCNFSNLQLDEADRYHVLAFDGYKFLGRTVEDRWAEYVKMHNGKPPQLYKLQGGKLTQ